jgi:SAM-dependent methyltransferase
MLSDDYKKVLESHAAQATSPYASVGLGGAARFAQVGHIQLALLKTEGLSPESVLLDFGCGVGRLALFALPYLRSGRYVGLDVSPTMIENAWKLAEPMLANSDASRFRLEVDDGENLLHYGIEFDFVCAFSVFTQMEHEDTLRCLRKFTSVLKRGGKVVCSVLNVETEFGKVVLLSEAETGHAQRWQRVRRVTTSYSMMENVAMLAGFNNFRWYRGDEFKINLDGQIVDGLRQSILVAEKL